MKHWLTIRNSSNSITIKNWSESEKTDSGNFSIQFKNQKYDIIHNIETWRKNIVIKKTNQKTNKWQRKKRSSKIRLVDWEIKLTWASHKASIFGNSTSHTPVKEICFELTHISSLMLSDDEKWIRWKFFLRAKIFLTTSTKLDHVSLEYDNTTRNTFSNLWTRLLCISTFYV